MLGERRQHCDNRIGHASDRRQSQAMPQVPVDQQRRTFHDTTLKPLDHLSYRQFDCEHFAFCTRLAADRDDLSAFGVLHDDIAQEAKAPLGCGADHHTRMTSPTGHQYLTRGAIRTNANHRTGHGIARAMPCSDAGTNQRFLPELLCV
jgi:hypothetical protein